MTGDYARYPDTNEMHVREKMYFWTYFKENIGLFVVK